ncbi:hypothetical protein Cgig2_029356 [Carnegiea gigantea]|uniref:Uncharacterized protein n=1 Tax=Carnegiea gigantea TaxID=171969 RepID=A0A9Q1KW55_9CARY|nr:hypothetical protein Cgig2_029356 [Carnegiea gigantea]
METETLDSSSISSSTKTTSWPIIRGSIDDSVTFESSIFAADSNSDHTDALKHKTPLILRRASPDSGPCEITIRLAHQHEVRQVYVRSTARIYEIYSAADEKSGNEYLCTVRCGLCAQNDDPMQVTDAVGSMPASYSGSNRCEEQGHSRAESGSSINEDGWVDIDTYGFIGGESCSEKEKQDFFEATAEISDADPVMSVTLRLLSIASGDYIYIDEVYIYADPVLSEDTDSSSNMSENAFGSSLMSMLVPTLLQLSKSRTSQMQQRNDSLATERRKSLDAEHKSTGAAINSGAYQSERMPNSEINSASVHMSQREVPGQAADPQKKPYPLGGENTFSCSHIERTLNELVFRISRIEQFCLRFEENMLKPISSMEARFEKVEQQLESFCKNAESCRTGWNRISAPECHNSESSSTWMNGNDSHGSTKSDSTKNNDCCHEEILIPSSEASSSANAVQCSDVADLVKSGDCCREVVEAPSFGNGAPPSDAPLSASASRLHPGLVVTAPDFSSIDDEEENDVIEATKDSPKDCLKKPLSIDDALASALAGFLSLASTDPSKCTHMVEEAAESPTMVKSINSSPLAVIQDVEPAGPSVDINGTNEPIVISLEEAALTEVRESLAADNSCEETTKAVGLGQFSEEEDRKDSVGSSVYGLPDVDKDNVEDSGSSIKLGFVEGDTAKSQALLSNFEAPTFLINVTLPNDHSIAHVEPQEAYMGAQDATAETADPICALAYMDSSSIKKVVKEDPDVLQNILELPIPATLDFETPILNVKFSSLENSSAKSLEALLVEMPESQNETLCMGEDNKSFSSEPTDLVVIEDGDSAACEASNNQFFLSSYDSCCLPSNTEEEQQDPHDCSDQDMCASLI